MLTVYNQVDSNTNDRFPSETIKFWLLVLAFFTPYVLAIGPTAVAGIRLFAPLWRFGTTEYPIFRFWPLEYLITELPFGLIRLVFIRYVLLFKERLTTATKLILIGILCELPGPVLSILAWRDWIFFPVPLFLVVGLLMARYSTKDPISWIEAKET